ncbi:MAG: hypothetical protein ACYC1M_18090 [Armatimonadota bacterium]
MKHYKIMATVIGLALFATGLCVAQEEAADTARVSIYLKSARVSDALETLFKQRPELKYSFRDQEIDQTPITMSLPDVSFDVALRNVLKAANLTYRKESDIYVITKQVDTVDGITAETTQIEEQKNTKRTEKIKLRYADASMIAYMMGGTILQVSGSYWQGGSNNNNNSNGSMGGNNSSGGFGNNSSSSSSNRSGSSSGFGNSSSSNNRGGSNGFR